MALRQRHKTKEQSPASTLGSTEGEPAKTAQNNNEYRRRKYHSDVAYREHVKKRSRDTYRKDNPKKNSRIKKGLLLEPTEKEVWSMADKELHTVRVFTIVEAAKALGKSALTLKKWIKESLVPPPILTCAAYGYKHYSEGELRLIAKQLLKHEDEYNYLHTTHDSTIDSMWQAMEAYRKENV